MESVTLYTTRWCPDCWRVKAFLRDRNIPFTEIFIESDPAAEELVLRVNDGRRKVPTLQVGERYFACSPFNAWLLADELNVSLNK